MKMFESAIILAGGKSSRMGFDKQFLEIDEHKLMDSIISKLDTQFREIILVTNKPDRYKHLSHKVITDIIIGNGPLSGIHAGLMEASSRYSFVMACDMPNINMDYVRYMISCIEDRDIDGCVTIGKDGVEPFSGFYSKRIVEKVESHLKKGKRSMHYLLDDLQIHYIKENIARQFSPDWDMFLNLNTIEDVGIYIEKLNQKRL